MRVIQLIQVLVLLALSGYAVLVSLENPVSVRLPLLFAGREAVLPAGAVVALSLLAGGLYVALLILPRHLQLSWRRRQDQTRRRQAEERLQATLQAVMLQAAPTPDTQPDSTPETVLST
ncbi:lipopolysaccharide assembly protein LapA domain-containing protein [Deinococcus sonorensis]|uniref:Lipopolysaccharide assembly protein LapA domain-containing protein n=2 Tax=Deinococcus sonorensis TaxID=309891 RepID=A0AAU7U8W6_9DEIO